MIFCVRLYMASLHSLAHWCWCKMGAQSDLFLIAMKYGSVEQHFFTQPDVIQNHFLFHDTFAVLGISITFFLLLRLYAV